MRTGRAGLMPESMTVSGDDERPPEWRHEAVGAPPWAADPVQSDGEPPPWELGPWPGPGEERPAGHVAGGAEAGSRLGGPAAGAVPRSAREAGNWQATAALVTGVLPLVLPGVVLGVLGLRQARAARRGRALSWLAIGVSAVWAVVLGVVLFGSSGSTAGGCTVPAAVRADYGRVVADMRDGASLGTVTADARAAASEANSAAAYAKQVPVRAALAALASDLEQVAGQRALPVSVRSQLGSRLSADAAALSKACMG